MVRLIFAALLAVFALANFVVNPALCAESARLVAFTFDDGPRQGFLEKALPYFRTERIRVTFFVLGGEVLAHPDLVYRAWSEGHAIENHTFTHNCLAKPSPRWNRCSETTPESAVLEVEKTSALIENITGRKPLFVRPPYFAMTPDRKRHIESRTGTIVLRHDDRVSVGSLDWALRDPRAIALRVIDRVEKTGHGPHIIVFHENEVTLAALPDIVAYFKRNEYRFVTIEELVRLSPETRL